MGLTFAQAFLRNNVVNSHQLYLLERSPDKAKHLSSLDVGTVYGSSGTWIGDADIIILAVKPQDTMTLYPTLSPYLQAHQVVLSIMAGVTLATISKQMKLPKIIRAMPNLPAQIGAGMTVYTATDAVSRSELVTVNNLLNSTGKTIYVEKESMIDAATAISGSGPAYVFYMMQALGEKAVELGFTQSQADLMAIQTFAGATAMLRAGKYNCHEWIGRVSSRGGTTEAAMYHMQDDQVAERFKAGIHAAYDRAITLGKEQ